MTHPQPYGQPVVPGVEVRTQVLVPPYRCSTAHVVIAWVLTLLTGFYLLPWAIAATRNRRNVAAVALVDLFLGWTVVGWFVALIMACGSDRQIVVVQHTYAPQPVWVPPAPVAQRAWTPAPPWSPPSALALEHTRVDPFSAEPTVWLPEGPGHGDRR